ncbi:MAG: hypothetical protein ABW318_03385, partial [Vicinamibacterales bacterium]
IGCRVMHKMRRRLRRLAGGWIVLQLSILIAVPTALRLTLPADLEAGSECTCSHGDAMSCPMHHPETEPNAPTCSYRSAANPAAAIAVSILGPSAVLTRSIAPAGLIATREILTSLTSHPIDIATVPDAPPPRA